MELAVTIPPLAFGLIDKFGTRMVFRRRVDRTYDPQTGSVNAAEQAFSVKGLFGTIRKTGTPAPNRKATSVTIASQTGFVPRVGDSIDVDSRTYSVVRMDATFAQGKVALYVLEVEA